MKVCVKGQSMYPCLKEGMEILAKESKYERVRVGDIVVVFDVLSSKALVHRVIKKKNGFIYVKGDNNWYMDKPVRLRNGNVLVVEVGAEGSILNGIKRKAFVFLSICRFWSFIHREPIKKHYKINGVTVSKEEYANVCSNKRNGSK